MTRKPGFTLDEHRHTGATLARAEYEVRKVLSAMYRLYVINSGDGAKVIRQLEAIGYGGLLLFEAGDNLAAIMDWEEKHSVSSENIYYYRGQEPLPRGDDWPDVAFRHVAFYKRVHRKTGFTVGDHCAAGAVLYRVRVELGGALIAVSRAYPHTTGRSGVAVKAIRRALGRLDKVRCKLDSIMAKEHPDNWATSVYYDNPSLDSVMAELVA